MEQVLLEMFEQARKLVVETDRRLAEENDRLQEKEREGKLWSFPPELKLHLTLPARKSWNSILGWMCRTANPPWNLLYAA